MHSFLTRTVTYAVFFLLIYNGGSIYGLEFLDGGLQSSRDNTLLICCVDFADYEPQLVVGCLAVRREWFQTNRHVYFGAYFWCRVVVVHLMPCSALIVLNALLVREMRRAQRRRAHLLAINLRRNECRRLADNNVTTLMLVVVVGLFLLVEFPLAVLFILLIVKHTFQLQTLPHTPLRIYASAPCRSHECGVQKFLKLNYELSSTRSSCRCSTTAPRRRRL